METAMRRLLVAISLAATTISAQALLVSAASAAPWKTIYIVPGVINAGADNDSGPATSFHCTNYSGASTDVRVLVYAYSAGLQGSMSYHISNNSTIAFATKPTFMSEVFITNPGNIQGHAVIQSRVTAVYCSAFVFPANAFAATGIGLHMVRLNPEPNTVE